MDFKKSEILKILKNADKDNIVELTDEETYNIEKEINDEMDKVRLRFLQKNFKSRIDVSKTFLAIFKKVGLKVMYKQ